jgi:hypothetical protein
LGITTGMAQDNGKNGTIGRRKMTIKEVSQERIIEELRDLEPSRWHEVLDFIGYLKHLANVEGGRTHPHKMTAHDLLQSDLMGIWADRADITDSLSFARQLRHRAEHRQEAANDIG